MVIVKVVGVGVGVGEGVEVPIVAVEVVVSVGDGDRVTVGATLGSEAMVIEKECDAVVLWLSEICTTKK